LVAYAVMGTAFSRNVLGVKHPKVGLMSNGEEDEKGTTFTKETFKLLKATPGIDFVGNVEGRDLFETELDVVLCDGFVGNIMLKTVEATAKAVSKWLKTEIKGNPLRLCGAVLAQGAFKALKEKSSYETYGGSPLLGVIFHRAGGAQCDPGGDGNRGKPGKPPHRGITRGHCDGSCGFGVKTRPFQPTSRL
jgi:phosphate acyltransferase